MRCGAQCGCRLPPARASPGYPRRPQGRTGAAHVRGKGSGESRECHRTRFWGAALGLRQGLLMQVFSAEPDEVRRKVGHLVGLR